jgi:molybdenum cofactor biosynthesis enzyme MoaA
MPGRGAYPTAPSEEGTMRYLTPEEIQAYPIDPRPEPGADRRAIARRRLEEAGQWTPRQQLGNRVAIGCVALEITQRCNLDCTCCYLSEHSEAVRDLPLTEVFRRIDLIRDYFGDETAVQVTGGDPTLRKKSELLQIVRRVRERGMRPTLFTNGIKTNREYLAELREAGLADVAFHVDLTQERKGYATEVELNAVRQQYVDSCRGNGLPAFFNFTVTEQNFHEIPEVVRFYVRNADVVKTASFQLQADTGRGTQRERAQRITQASVTAQIEAGAGISINFDASPVGHTKCNRYAMCFAVNGKLYNALDDSAFITRIAATGGVAWDRYTCATPFQAGLRWVQDHPGDLWSALRYTADKVRRAWRDLIAARGRVNRISFFLHNFMDACQLEPDRIKACSFYTVTRDGPVSMCLANAKRDEYILQRIPVEAEGAAAAAYWDPLTGETAMEDSSETPSDPTQLPLKRLKGRSRQVVAQRRQSERLLQIAPPQSAAEAGSGGE